MFWYTPKNWPLNYSSHRRSLLQTAHIFLSTSQLCLLFRNINPAEFSYRAVCLLGKADVCLTLTWVLEISSRISCILLCKKTWSLLSCRVLSSMKDIAAFLLKIHHLRWILQPADPGWFEEKLLGKKNVPSKPQLFVCYWSTVQLDLCSSSWSNRSCCLL